MYVPTTVCNYDLVWYNQRFIYPRDGGSPYPKEEEGTPHVCLVEEDREGEREEEYEYMGGEKAVSACDAFLSTDPSLFSSEKLLRLALCTTHYMAVAPVRSTRVSSNILIKC